MSVPTEWEQAAVRAWDRSTSDHLNGPALQAALAAVAPIIAKAERERCAVVAIAWDKGRSVYDDLGEPIPSIAGDKIAKIILALGDAA